jgi:hypothetical protein
MRPDEIDQLWIDDEGGSGELCSLRAAGEMLVAMRIVGVGEGVLLTARARGGLIALITSARLMPLYKVSASAAITAFRMATVVPLVCSVEVSIPVIWGFNRMSATFRVCRLVSCCAG